MKRFAWIGWYMCLLALASFGVVVNAYIYVNRDVFKKANGLLTPSLIVEYLLLFVFSALKLGKHLRSGSAS